MRSFKKLLFFVVVVLIVSATVVFVLENQQPVALVFFGWSAPELTMAVPVILALLVGMVIGPVIGYVLRIGRKNSRKVTSPPRD